MTMMSIDPGSTPSGRFWLSARSQTEAWIEPVGGEEYNEADYPDVRNLALRTYLQINLL
jgi:hypothetical protein